MINSNLVSNGKRIALAAVVLLHADFSGPLR
jgi:hypothetical protein